jgi:hypothetical protein
VASSQIAVNPVTNTIYVINVVNSNVAVVDGLTHTVLCPHGCFSVRAGN